MSGTLWAMSNKERIVYALIILAEFVMVLLFYSQSSRYRALLKQKPQHPAQETNARLYSFPGKALDQSREELVHFSAYNRNYYIIATISQDCHHCTDLKEEVESQLLVEPLKKNIKLMLIHRDDAQRSKTADDVGILKVTEDDWIQFGLTTPSIFVSDGKGHILYKQEGYNPGFISRSLKIINDHENKGTKSIDIK